VFFAMTGRRPIPDHLKVVNGNPGKRPLNRKPPKTDVGAPVCPAHLSDEAKVQWGRFSVLLEQMGVLTTADGAALEQLSELYVEATTLRRDIKTNGHTLQVTSTQGEKVAKANPSVAMLRAVEIRIAQYLIEFGLTPAARTRVHTVGNFNDKPAAPEVPSRPADSYF
jgi:P27 family predicted phage terminase small subunit